MNNEQLAEFHGVNLRSTYRWTPETKHKKTIQAKADVTPDEWRLIGEIMQLVYLYNSKGWDGAKRSNYALVDMNSFHLQVAFNAGNVIKVTFSDTNAAAQMELLKRQLEQLVYGEVK